jgi:hypothetical protein
VPTTLVSPQKYKKFLYSTTPHKKRLGVDIEASSPIDVYIVRKSHLLQWRSSRDYGGIGFQRTKRVEAEVNIPSDFEPEWYLILENIGDNPAAVHYELFDL